MSTCERYDFPHAPVWCPECHARESQSIIAREMRRANDLKEREVIAKEQGYWQEPEVRVVRQYTPPARVEQPKPQSKGGMNIEPIGES
jgi:hypothetical protein